MTDFLGSAVTVAGIGGVGFAIFYLLCREVIRQKIFPNLTKDQAYKIIRLIIVLAFIVSMAGLIAWMYDRRPTPPPPTPTVAKLEWVREKSDSNAARWRLLVTSGSIRNLDVYSVEFLSLGSKTGITIRTAWPLRGNNEEGYHLNFLQVNEDLEIIFKSLTEKTLFNIYPRYQILVKATYDNEITGVTFRRVWDFSFAIDENTSNWAASAEPKDATTSDFDYATEELKQIQKCGRSYAGPNAIHALSIMPKQMNIKVPKTVDWNSLIQNDECTKA